MKSIFVLVYDSFEKLYSKVIYSCNSSLQSALLIILFAQATFVCECTSYPIVSHDTEYGTLLNYFFRFLSSARNGMLLQVNKPDDQNKRTS